MCRDVVHMGASRVVAGMAAWQGTAEVARMGTSRDVAHMAASRDLIRSRRRQPPEPHTLAHKMRRESRQIRRMAGSNLVIELPHQLGRRSHHQ
jgi:hypothetical protein